MATATGMGLPAGFLPSPLTLQAPRDARVPVADLAWFFPSRRATQRGAHSAARLRIYSVATVVPGQLKGILGR